MDDPIKIRKQKIRREYLILRDSIPEDKLIKKSKIIADHFLMSPEYLNCENLFIYRSMGSEVITDFIIEAALAAGKNVALPVMTDKKKREMVFIKIISLDNLKTNSFGVSEPEYDETNIVTGDPRVLIAAPGVAFSKDGSRAGYGGGYYDRYLSLNKYSRCVGLCFEAQLAEHIPSDSSDVKMDALVTENGVVRIRPV